MHGAMPEDKCLLACCNGPETLRLCRRGLLKGEIERTTPQSLPRVGEGLQLQYREHFALQWQSSYV